MVATKCGIAQKCKMDTRDEITEDEEAIWNWYDCGKKALLEDFQLSHWCILFIFITVNVLVFELANTPGEGVLPHKNDGGARRTS